ncbi:hypothetical protein J1605_004581 [Eschrichtius robustus]|uniref:Solute carrier family 22 member 23 n=1 Tax=Eschrichtius robustus TaxID=9764 RepID=A0AB34HEE2_ESCRO|nr:hypothetical protein J1605_004581 [Eschrichtius robustus]
MCTGHASVHAYAHVFIQSLISPPNMRAVQGQKNTSPSPRIGPSVGLPARAWPSVAHGSPLPAELEKELSQRPKKVCIVKVVGTRNLWKNIVVLCVNSLTGFGIHHCFARSMMGHEVKVPLLENFYADYYTAAGIALASCLAVCPAVRVLGRRGGLLLFMILTALASLLQLGLLNRRALREGPCFQELASSPGYEARGAQPSLPNRRSSVWSNASPDALDPPPHLRHGPPALWPLAGSAGKVGPPPPPPAPFVPGLHAALALAPGTSGQHSPAASTVMQGLGDRPGLGHTALGVWLTTLPGEAAVPACERRKPAALGLWDGIAAAAPHATLLRTRAWPDRAHATRAPSAALWGTGLRPKCGTPAACCALLAPPGGMSDSVKDKFSITFSIVGMFASHAVGNLSVFFCAEITPTVIRSQHDGTVPSSLSHVGDKQGPVPSRQDARD